MAVANNFAPGKSGTEYMPNTYAELGEMIGKMLTNLSDKSKQKTRLQFSTKCP